MIFINKKLEEIYIDLWEFHNSQFFLNSLYIVIFFYKQLQKTWILYFRLKDKFVNKF